MGIMRGAPETLEEASDRKPLPFRYGGGPGWRTAPILKAGSGP
jgi:hypothetical protein